MATMSKRGTEVDSASTSQASISRIRADRIDISRQRSAKRERTFGLNARFDRMVKSVNTILSYSDHSRKRMKSESSATSSASSHDVPETPVEACNSIHSVNSGRGFSLLKRKISSLHPQGESDGYPNPVAPSRGPRSPLPDWLADTFSSLEPGHPLRGLVLPSYINSEPTSLLKLPSASHEEELFAFSPFELNKQDGVPETSHRVDHASTERGNVLPVVPENPTPLYRRSRAVANTLPFSTLGRLPPIHRLTTNLNHGTSREPLVPAPQQVTSRVTNIIYPSAPLACALRSDDEIAQSRVSWTLSNLIQGNGGVSSDFQGHNTFTGHDRHLSRGDEDNLNVYATPGPTLACSGPVYFDSPTEDPSLSDPLQPESYELDLNTLDFRWRPFLRSDSQENKPKENHASPLPAPRHVVPRYACDQGGWYARFPVDQGNHGTSSEELPYFTEDVQIANLGDAGSQPSNVNTGATDSSAIDNSIKPWATDSDVVEYARPASLAPADFLSPLRDHHDPSALLAADGVPPHGDGENLHMTEELFLLPCKEITTVDVSQVHGILRPSTPTKQVPVSPPSTPHKVRSGQRYEMSRAPARKTSSALSWMMPLKFSKRVIMAQDGVSSRFSRVAPDSHDSIESWSKTD